MSEGGDTKLRIRDIVGLILRMISSPSVINGVTFMTKPTGTVFIVVSMVTTSGLVSVFGSRSMFWVK
jgi:hypothetical protein